MTEKEKAKTYDEAIERAKKIYGNRIIEEIFPELKEEDAERIRKNCIHFLELQKQHHAATFEIEECIDWLEKQGLYNELQKSPSILSNSSNTGKNEQKTTNKTEPKFKVGDWIVFNGLTLYIKEVVKGFYRTISKGGISNSYDWDIDNIARLWVIQDAKDGDVLTNDHHILILKELVYDWSSNGTPYSVKAYCGIKPNGNFEIGKDNWCFCGTLHIHPATKEQHDTLMKSMNDAGYVWDEKKNELRELIKPKFDPKTLQPFDKVLVKNSGFPWRCDIFSYYQRNKRITCHCISDDYIYDRCIPYNEDTKHLVGTTEEVPEFYRYWEA